MVSACSKVPALKHGGLDRDLVDQGVRRESLPSLAVQLLAHCLSLVAQPQGERTERASASPRYSHGTPARSTPQTNIPACFVLCVGWCNLTLSVGKNRRETYGGKNAGGKNEAEPPAAAKRAMVSGFRHTAATRPPHSRHTATAITPAHICGCNLHDMVLRDAVCKAFAAFARGCRGLILYSYYDLYLVHLADDGAVQQHCQPVLAALSPLSG